DPWASVQGTAVHAWLADLFETRDPNGERYLVEQKVTVRKGITDAADITGSADLYDRATGTVFDWKIVGTSSLAKYRRHGPGDQYRIQANLYGLGMRNAGEDPKRVAIVFLPRHHILEPFVWVDDFRPDVAEAALARLDQIREQILRTDPEANPAAWSAFPTSPDAKCFFCPWRRPDSTDLATGCPGHQTPCPHPRTRTHNPARHTAESDNAHSRATCRWSTSPPQAAASSSPPKPTATSCSSPPSMRSPSGSTSSATRRSTRPSSTSSTWTLPSRSCASGSTSPTRASCPASPRAAAWSWAGSARSPPALASRRGP